MSDKRADIDGPWPRERGAQRPFETELLTDLRKQTISRGLVTVAAQGAKAFINLVSVVVLARLLTPEDFGLVAIVTAVMSFLRVLKDAGLATATVQKERLTHAQLSNLFWTNAALSTLVSFALAATAPAIALFFGDPRLVGIALLLSLAHLLSGLTVQHQALLSRQLRFRTLALIEIGSTSMGLIVGVVMALLGGGYWSLVYASLTAEAASVALTWTASTFRPLAPRRRSGTRPLLVFGASLTVGNALYALSRGADSVLIGWRYGPDSVGLYSRALALLTRPLEQFLIPVAAVVAPTLARLQGEPERYRRVFMQVYETIALVGFASSALLLALSHPLIVVLLGPKWEEAATIFGGFAIAAMYMPLAACSTWLLSSQGRGSEYLLANSLLSAVTLAGFVAGLPFGPLGVAISFSISGLLIRLPILYYFAGRRGPVSAKDLWRGLVHLLPVWAAVFAATCMARLIFGEVTALPQLLVSGGIGSLAGLALACAFATPRRVARRCFEALRPAN